MNILKIIELALANLDDCLNDLEKINKLITFFINNKVVPLSYGTTRIVFEYKNKIYKLPIAGNSTENFYEYFSYISNKGKVYIEGKQCNLAKCDLIYHKGIPILEMEKVTPITEHIEEYHHYKYMGDGTQIGYTKRGKVVSFDYGHHSRVLCKNFTPSLQSFLNSLPIEMNYYIAPNVRRELVPERPRHSPDFPP